MRRYVVKVLLLAVVTMAFSMAFESSAEAGYPRYRRVVARPYPVVRVQTARRYYAPRVRVVVGGYRGGFSTFISPSPSFGGWGGAGFIGF